MPVFFGAAEPEAVLMLPLTFILAEETTEEPDNMLILAVPAPTPLMTPLLFTVHTPSLELLKVNPFGVPVVEK